MDGLNESNNTNENNLHNGLSRRNLVRGLAAAPVVLSVASRPVWGQGPCSISGLLSGNLSRAPGSYECTTGGQAQSAEFWFANRTLWPTPYVPETSFSSVFGAASPYGNTFVEILDPANNGAASLDIQLVAALLSAAHPGVNYGKTDAEIIEAYAYVRDIAPAKTDTLRDILTNLNARPSAL
jgi:hypothetical protein